MRRNRTRRSGICNRAAEESLGVTRMVTVRSGGRRFSEGGILTPLGMVVSEHVDKLALFETAVKVVEKNVTEDAVSFTLDMAEGCPKSLDEIVRGYRIGCFRIAREYGLIAPDDPTPIFSAHIS